MEITQTGGQRFITVGPIVIEVKPMIIDLINEVRKLSQDEHVAIISDAGVIVPEKLEPHVEIRETDHIMFETHPRLSLAMSICQQEWYRAQQGAVPENVAKGHADRLVRFKKLADKPQQIIVRPEPKAKVVKAPKEPKAPKLPKATKPQPVLPELPTRMRSLVFEPVANVPSVVLSDGQSVPILFDSLDRTIDELRKRPDVGLYAQILIDSGVSYDGGLDAARLYLLAASFVILWWHELAVEHHVIETVPIELGISVRKTYQEYIKKATGHSNRAPKQPKVLTFKVSNSDLTGLGKRFKKVLEAAVAVSTTDDIPVEQLVAKAIELGYKTSEANQPYSIRWVALQLVKSGHLFVVGTQSEIPGTPAKLPG